MQRQNHARGEAHPTFVAIAIGAAMAIGLAGSPASARPIGNELPADLAQAWQDYDRATVDKDVARLATLITDDYMLVNSDSSVQDKKSYLADFALPGFKLDAYEIEQPLRKVWGDAALTGGIFTLNWTQAGRHLIRRLRVAHVWSKKDGRWRIAYTQLTRVPE